MIAAVLREHAGEAAVLATAGNQNNDIGVPLTLLRMNAAHRFAAIELGMNHPGEIAVLAGMTRPTVALVNNAQREHLEFMNSVEAVADENASVFDALPDEGAAVINADDLRAERFRSRAGGRRLFDFALLPRPGNECSVRGGYAGGGLSSEIEIRTSAGSVRTSLAIAGEHNVRNALAAAACATAAGIPLPAIGRGLAAFRPSRGRMETKRRRDGAVVIDDSYNANPDSVIAAIDVLAECGTSSLLVLGDMGEVGADGPRLHAEAGRYARERGIGALYASGVLARLASEAFGPAGRHFDSVEELAARAEEIARRGDTVLVKGSRFMRMERVVQHLVGEPTAELH
jgi:UDP-N-acetylmuramoyl-tripeptide--D-alanyl-D-alanine ligase